MKLFHLSLFLVIFLVPTSLSLRDKLKKLFKKEKEKCNVFYEDKTTLHCSTTYEQQCVDEWKEECKTEFTTDCVEEYQQECHTEYGQECHSEHVEQCKSVPDCHTTYEQECGVEYETKCENRKKPKGKTVDLIGVVAPKLVAVEKKWKREAGDEDDEDDVEAMEAMENLEALTALAGGRKKRGLTGLVIGGLALKHHLKKKKNPDQEICHHFPKDVCHDVPREHCTEHKECWTEPHETCVQVPHESCNSVPHQRCTEVPHQTCKQVPHQQCWEEPHEHCHDLKVRVGKKICKKGKGFGKKLTDEVVDGITKLATRVRGRLGL